MIGPVAAILLASMAQTASDAARAVRAPVLTFPGWSIRPGFAELTEAARAAGIEIGVVQLSCGLGREGRLGECVVLKASHRDMGLEAVALEVVREARLAFSSYDRLAANTQVRFEIVLS
jgi:hypothetical protein